MTEPMPVTYLFVPANRPDRFEKAIAAGADRIILDLEDAVPVGQQRYRAGGTHWSRMDWSQVLVRVNPSKHYFLKMTCEQLQQRRPAGINDRQSRNRS